MEHSIRPIAFRPEWVKACGDVESTIFYQQLYYWVSTKRDEDISTVWIYKSISDFEFETTLTDKEQRKNAIKQINENYPEMLGNITLENIGTENSIVTGKQIGRAHV